MDKKNIGSTFDTWLQEEGIYEEVTANAIRRVSARQSAEKEEDDRRGAAMETHYKLDLLIRGLPMPQWARYVVRCADDYKTVSVVLVTKRKNPRWPNWEKIATLVPCERIVEDVDPDTHHPRKTLHF